MILVLVISLRRPDIPGMETVRVFKAPFVLFYKSKPIRKDTVYFYLFIGFLQGTCQFSVENDLKRFKGYNVANLPLHMQSVWHNSHPLQNFYCFFISFLWHFLPNNHSIKHISKHILFIGNFKF